MKKVLLRILKAIALLIPVIALVWMMQDALFYHESYNLYPIPSTNCCSLEATSLKQI